MFRASVHHAGLCEIGGSYLVWQWWRSGASGRAGLIGAVLLVGYGFVPTFGRHTSAVSTPRGLHRARRPLGWGIDRIAPDRFDLLGAALCLAGVAVIMHWPRYGLCRERTIAMPGSPAATLPAA